jgi:tetratricopeptide (TPR) repeat protein
VTEHSEGDQDGVARGIALRPSADARLIEKQIEFLERQGLLQRAELDQLRETQHGLKLRNHRERLRFVFEMALAVVAVIIAGLLIHLVYAAWHTHRVVVGVFDAPPAFETEGLSGTVVASVLRDRLQALQLAARPVQNKRAEHDPWSGGVEVAMPETGLGKWQHDLQQWLGEEVQIAGDLVQTRDGITLTVRSNEFPAKAFEAKADDLQALSARAAEYVYGQSQPARFARYLIDHGREAEAITVVKSALPTKPRTDQAALLNVWGLALLSLDSVQEALDTFRQAVALKPDDWMARSNIVRAQLLLQHEEAAFQDGREFERLTRRGGWRAEQLPPDLYWPVDRMRWDLAALRQTQLAVPGDDSEMAAAPWLFALQHDPRAAELALKRSTAADGDTAAAQAHVARGLMAMDCGDFAGALPELQAADTEITASKRLQSLFDTAPSCWLALAESRDPTIPASQVDADLARGGHRVDCYRFKADISDRRGDWTLAQKQYAEAAALAPSLPGSYYSWGEALARHRDYAGAIAKFKEASERGPHWCDPLKSWGDALATQKDFKAAVKRYELAEPYAPNWGQLHLHWAMALEQLGKTEQAKRQYRRALEEDLVDVDRAAAAAAVARL